MGYQDPFAGIQDDNQAQVDTSPKGLLVDSVLDKSLSPSAREEHRKDLTSSTLFDRMGAAAAQATTFGGMAHVDEFIGNKTKGDKEDPRAGVRTRELAEMFNKDHPLAGFALGLLSPSPVSKLKAVGNLGSLAKSAIIGAEQGALGGAASGELGTINTDAAAQSGILGGVMGGALGKIAPQVSKIISKQLEKYGISSANKKATETVAEAFYNDKDAMAKLSADPSQSLAQVSPSVMQAVKKAISTHSEAKSKAQELVDKDFQGQNFRMKKQAELAQQPLLPLKKQISEKMQELEKTKNTAYKDLQKDTVPIDSELNSLRGKKGTPEANAWNSAWDKYIQIANRGDIETPKIGVGKQIPVKALDIWQQELGTLIDKAENSNERISLQKLQKKVVDHIKDKNPNFKAAFDSSAEMGGAARAGFGSSTEPKQQTDPFKWGRSFANAGSEADIKTFNSYTPFEKENAKFAFIDGMEDHLRKNLSPSQLNEAAGKMDDPFITDVIGKNYANSIKKAFMAEATRIKNNSKIASPTLTAEQRMDQRVDDKTGQALGTVNRGGVMGALSKFYTIANTAGISKEQATKIVELAASPNGLKQLKDAKISKDIIYEAQKANTEMARKSGVVAGQLANEKGGE